MIWPPAVRRRARRRDGGFTLVEMLTTVALLIIVLGLMVSLARYVRRRSAEDLTRKVLVNLHVAMSEYIGLNGGPPIRSFIEGKDAVETLSLKQAAEENNLELVRFLRSRKDLSAKAFRDLPTSIYDETSVRDAWGTPIVYMPAMHPQIGMAANNDAFFVSAGPDRQYLTRDDNQYSYEALGASSP
jgi:type II secretory pathway pseudopilin PulG